MNASECRRKCTKGAAAIEGVWKASRILCGGQSHYRVGGGTKGGDMGGGTVWQQVLGVWMMRRRTWDHAAAIEFPLPQWLLSE